jgi:hypothetical protein
MVATDAAITDEIKTFKARQSDLATPTAFAVKDEVQSISTFNGTATSGNFTLTINLDGESAFTTGNIAWNASAATIEGAINTAATTANVTGWANGDISVALTTNLNNAAATLTFDGDSVDETRHALTVMNKVDLDANVSTVTVTTYGQPKRVVWAAMDAMGLVTGGPPPRGTTTGLTANTTRDSNFYYPRQETLQALAMQAAIEDDHDPLYAFLMNLFGQRHAV